MLCKETYILFMQGAHAGLIRSYNVLLCFLHLHFYKAIRKVLFLRILTERSYKGLIFSSQ